MAKKNTQSQDQEPAPELAQEKTTELATMTPAGALDTLDGYAEFAGAGFEHQTNEDITIPFVTIVQGMSPVLRTRTELRPGMIINTVTGDALDGKQGFAFVPVVTQHVFVEWKPRKEGGGFVGIHKVGTPIVDAAKAASTEFGKYKTEAGNDLIETFYTYGLAVGMSGDESAMQVAIAFSGTKIKKYKQWMTTARSIQIKLSDGRRIAAPLFAHVYRVTSVDDSNAKGDFYNWGIRFDGPDAASARLLPGNPLFQAAIAFKQSIDQGLVRAAFESERAAGEDDAGGSAQPAPGQKPVF